ncbi:fungal pheromone STE3G-protein-coupled receptor [Athelia psychrophila]|uniref:Fungal pheromone STE3G-protein-coupled receptor n=1 Tax=Athelia psychrophila TaxID=1759441 RepID=A0A166R389_9AGAM|nr:fungal pheromone STE3G-protein-coupled receptor [Fibularhizoctonia sp. CBS 109695]
MHAELPVGAFVAALLSLAPLPWHWRARNVSTISLIVWLFVMNVIAGVNAIIWRDSAMIMATVWCDIATKLQVGATIALPACCLCICIQLEQIASVRMATMSIDYKKRRMVFDACMCWLLPMVYMALHYVVQGHRFDIVEVTGCSANLYVSLPAILLISVPPLVISILMFIYAGLALVHFFKRRLTFGRHLDSSGLTTSRYFRLMCMSIVEMTVGITISSIDTWSNYQYGMRPWTSWSEVHSNFSQINQFPWVEIPQTTRNWTLGLWWTVPISSVIFFAFFSFGEDAVREYRACFMWFRRVVLRQNSKRDHGGMTVLGSTPSLTRQVFFDSGSSSLI